MIFVTQKKSVYVDSVAGSDANDGLTATTPKATCAAGMTVLASSGRKTIRLKCGSFFREQITLPAGKRLKNYGTGDRPILDCRNQIPTEWAKAGGYVNLYSVVVPHSIYDPQSPAAHRVWESGVRMVRASGIATCDSTPGSFWAGAPSGTSQTIYVHATGSGNPSINGFLYEFAARLYGVEMNDGCMMDGIDTRCNPSNSGSIRALARGVVIRNCTASDGYIHNVLIADGICENVVASGAEPLGGVGTQTAFVAYNNFTSGGKPSVTYRRCQVEMETMPSLAMYAWYSHGAASYAKIVFEDCKAHNCSYAFGGIDCDSFIISRCSGDNTKFFIKPESETDYVIYRSRFIGSAVGSPNEAFLNGKFRSAKIRHCEYAVRDGAVFATRSTPATLDVRYCTITPADSAIELTFRLRPNDRNTLRNNILWAPGTIFVNSTAGLTLTDTVSDQNLLYSTRFPSGSSSLFVQKTYGAWKAWTQWKDMGFDGVSVLANPQRLTSASAEQGATFDPAGPVFTSGFPVGVQPTDDEETLALLASVGYTP